MIALILFLAACPALAEEAEWTCPSCHQTGLRTNFCFNCGEARPQQTACGCGYLPPDDSSYMFCPMCGASLVADEEVEPLAGDESAYPSEEDADRDPDEPYDIGIPKLGDRVIRRDEMNLIVLWVQTQLKATGTYYQGEIWDVTGNLGDHTMTEIASFMRARGYDRHSGQIDQALIDELAAYLNDRIVPVYAGGFYEKMNTIMIGGSTGSMDSIVSNLRDMVPRVTVGARWIQCCLSKLNYYDGAIDGKFGEGTESALKRFQGSHGFQERDYVSLGVARALIEECHRRGIPLYDLP